MYADRYVFERKISVCYQGCPEVIEHRIVKVFTTCGLPEAVHKHVHTLDVVADRIVPCTEEEPHYLLGNMSVHLVLQQISEILSNWSAFNNPTRAILC